MRKSLKKENDNYLNDLIESQNNIYNYDYQVNLPLHMKYLRFPLLYAIMFTSLALVAISCTIKLLFMTEYISNAIFLFVFLIIITLLFIIGAICFYKKAFDM